MLRYAVIADGSLRIAHAKGEVKKRYWNPGDIFDQVHVVTLTDDDIDPDLVQSFAGRAQLFVYPVGKPRPGNLWELRRRVVEVMSQIRPDIIRGHGPFLQGYYATYAARELEVPSFVSIHDDVSIYRRFWTYGKGYGKITLYQLGLKALGWEGFVFENADRLVPKYQAAARLLRKTRHRDKVQVIYNQIFLEDLTDQKPDLSRGERLRIINVGRQFDGKDQRPLIRALKNVDAELTLIGQGPLRNSYVSAARESGVENRVTFIDRVDNADLPSFFAGHHLFAINIIQPGICMPAMEAMALGYPIVINEPRWESEPEVCGPCADVVRGTAEGFTEAFQRFIDDPRRVSELGARSRATILSFSGERMEAQEKDLILDLLGRDQARNLNLAT